MQISFLLCLSAAAAFAPSARTASRAAVAAAPRMGALVPVDKPNKRLAAGAAGFVVGSMLGGPVVGAILAAGANQGSKVEGAAGDTFLTIGEFGIKGWNFVADTSENTILPQARKIDGFDEIEDGVSEATGKVSAFLDEQAVGAKLTGALEAVEGLIDKGVAFAGEKIKQMT